MIQKQGQKLRNRIMALCLKTRQNGVKNVLSGHKFNCKESGRDKGSWSVDGWKGKQRWWIMNIWALILINPCRGSNYFLCVSPLSQNICTHFSSEVGHGSNFPVFSELSSGPVNPFPCATQLSDASFYKYDSGLGLSFLPFASTADQHIIL